MDISAEVGQATLAGPSISRDSDILDTNLFE
jgi:hypothetical protein